MKKALLFLIIILSFFLLNIEVFALTVGPYSPIKIELENGNKFFYLTPLHWDSSLLDPRDPDYNKKYPPSGLYYNTDPPEIIYLIDSNSDYSYFVKDNIYLSDDGIYFVNFSVHFYWGPEEYVIMPPPPGRISALEFYANGNFIRSYDVLELVKDSSKLRLEETTVVWRKQEIFDAKNNILSVTTIDDITYKFDITTGKIINDDSSTAPKTGDNLIFFIIILFAVAVLVNISRKINNFRCMNTHFLR